VYALPVEAATTRRLELSNSGRSDGVANRKDLDAATLTALHTMLLASNDLVRSFRASHADSASWTIAIPSLSAHATEATDDVAGILINGGSSIRSLVVPFNSGHLLNVPELNAFYQPLHFVLLFPFGNSQWSPQLRKTTISKRKRARMDEPDVASCLDFLRYYVQRRCSRDAVSMHSYGRLFEEWVVDVFLQHENITLNYLSRNQDSAPPLLFVCNTLWQPHQCFTAAGIRCSTAKQLSKYINSTVPVPLNQIGTHTRRLTTHNTQTQLHLSSSLTLTSNLFAWNFFTIRS
jgi:hypothetical protein